MKLSLKLFANIPSEKVFKVSIKYYQINDDVYIKGIKDVTGDLTFYYDDNDDLSINYYLKGLMICPDCMTLEDVEVPFSLSEDSKVVYKIDEDGFYLEDDISLEELVCQIIIPEAPIKVEKNKEKMYYSGDGWTISSEEEYNKASRENIDPRLEKLLEYKEGD